MGSMQAASVPTKSTLFIVLSLSVLLEAQKTHTMIIYDLGTTGNGNCWHDTGGLHVGRERQRVGVRLIG